MPEKEPKDVLEGVQAKKKVKHNPDFVHQTMNGMDLEIDWVLYSDFCGVGGESMGMNAVKNNLYNFKDEANKNRDLLDSLQRDERDVLGGQSRNPFQIQAGKGNNSWGIAAFVL